MHPLFEDWVRSETRRQFFRRGANALGSAALASLLGGGIGSARRPRASAPAKAICRSARISPPRPST